MLQNEPHLPHEQFMKRCLELASRGSFHVAPNPMVGAVLVHEGRIIGEGFHQKFGEAHAEVNCLDSVPAGKKHLIPDSILYVSLEPCSHFGKTPPCADLIIKHHIHKVVVGSRDPNKKVSGGGIGKLQAAGVQVESGVMEKECTELNRRFFTYHTKHRPYIILKWAETADQKISGTGNGRLLISHESTNRLVHKWRAEEASVLVGTRTALADNPQLTNRYWNGPSPVRLVVDMELKLPPDLWLFDQKVRTVVFNKLKHDETGMLNYYQVTDDVSLVHQILNGLYQMNIQSVLVEGGARLIQSFLNEDMWDEIRVIRNENLTSPGGLAAPELPADLLKQELKIPDDTVNIYFRQNN